MLTCQRALFSLPEGLHYLNCAARAPLLKSAEFVGIAGLQRQRVPDSSLFDEAYVRLTEGLRMQLGQLINAPADAIAFSPAASYGLAIAAHNVPLRRGQNVVLPDGDFPSDVYAWSNRCAAVGAELRLVPCPPGAERPASAWSERLQEAIDRNSAVVNLSTLNWSDGLRFDLAAIGARAREVGAWFVVDGSQTIGAAPFDFAALQPDLVVCVGHKWLLGPYQFGFVAVGERLREASPFEEAWGNRAGSENGAGSAYFTDYRPGARRFDVGEHGNPVSLPMLDAGVRQVAGWSAPAIQAYCAQLNRRLDALCRAERAWMAPASQRYEHIVGLRLPPGAELPRIVAGLRARNLLVSQRRTSLRVSPHVYNSPEDMDALCDALTALLA